MKVAIMQPYFLPHIGYFHLIDSVDEFIFFDDVNFIKRGWINRNNFLVQNKAHLFSVSLSNASQNELIKDVKINYTLKWEDDFMKLLKHNYSKAKHFGPVFDLIKKIFQEKFEFISDLNIALTLEICEYLGIKKKFQKSSDIDYVKSGTGVEKIISLCQIKGATEYVNAIGGMGLYDKTIFISEKIQLHFIESRPIVYTQIGNNFVPHLSILDVLMFCDISEVNEHIKKYSLI